MISRSGQVCAHSEPIAPAWNFCSKMVQTLASADTHTNGASGRTSRQRIRPFIHQIQSPSTTGNMTTEGLLRVAKTKKKRDRTNVPKQRRFAHRRCPWLGNVVPCPCHLKKHKIDDR